MFSYDGARKSRKGMVFPMCQMKIILKDRNGEKVVLENAALLEVAGEGILVNAMFEKPHLIQGAAVSRIDFLENKVTLTRSAGHPSAMEPKTTVEKLQVLLPHWLEHNTNHKAEFMKWAAAARGEGAESLAKLLDAAAENMAGADGILKRVQTAVGGAGDRHHLHHP